MPEYVRVENVDERPFKYHHRDSPKVIPPGKAAMMPWDLATTLFGDPFATNSEKKPDRTASLARARANFNFELGMETMDVFEARRPKLETYDADNGQRIYMLIDDPEGAHSADYVPMDIDASDPMALLQTRMVELQAQMATLINQQTSQPASTPTGETSTSSVDGPPIAAPGTAKQAQFIEGDPFHQRPEDAATPPIFDFGNLSTSDAPPVFADTPGRSSSPGRTEQPGHDPASSGPSIPDATANPPVGEAGPDTPADAGVGSDGGPDEGKSGKLAPKPKR